MTSNGANGVRSFDAAVGAKPNLTLALRKDAAAAALGVSDETFDKHIRPSLPVVRVGSTRIYPVALLERWLIEQAVTPADELAEALR
jgi:hypothetical protein